MDATPTNKARIARVLAPVGMALVLVGAGFAALVDPWLYGALIAGVGATDLLVAFVLSRSAAGEAR
jgi:hypothetical protein